MQEEDTQVQNIPKWITKEMCKNEYYVLIILAKALTVLKMVVFLIS